MTPAQVAAVYGTVQLVDRRQDADQALLAYWVQLIGDLDFQDALDAVAVHRRTSTDYLTPAHIQAGARRIRARRARLATQGRALTASGPPSFARTPEQQAHVSERAQWLREQYRQARAASAQQVADDAG